MTRATISTHPDGPELLAVAMGEPNREEVAAHLRDCRICSDRVERFRVELSAMPQDSDCGAILAATDPDSALNCEIKPHASVTTLTWPNSATGEAGTAPIGPEAPGAAGARAEGRPDRPVAIGKYLVIGLLDWGGEADVYQVLHPNLGKEMVLKLARRPVEGDERTALVAEGRLLIDLEHINLVRVFDSGFHDNRPYLVMEYVHGPNLEQYARDKRVSPRRAAELTARMAKALEVVHKRGVIHRDIKPRNILIDEEGEPRLIDFGLARLRNAWSNPLDTTWGGTLPFIAPEQARLEHDRTGPRSDIFGLGAVLYYLLTGQPPFTGATRDEVWDQAQRGEIDKSALRKVRVPRQLERVCLKALAAEPADRYASAEEFGRALHGCLRRPATAIAGVALLVVAAVALSVGSLAWRKTQGVDDPTIEVHRGNDIIKDLSGALPLQTGDQLRIRFEVPAGRHISAFWYDSDGRLAQLGPLAIVRIGRADEVVYPRPGPGRDVVPLEGAPGTELLLICARRRSKPSEDDIRPIISDLARLPVLDERTYLLFDTESVRVHGKRKLGGPQASRVGEARAVLDSIRKKLRERCDFVAGLAIPHVATGPDFASRSSAQPGGTRHSVAPTVPSDLNAAKAR